MITTFQADHNNCPQYIIFYTTNLACIRPATPSCAQMVIDARRNLKQGQVCPQIPFYLYSTETIKPGYVTDKQNIIFASSTGIIPLNPNHVNPTHGG